MAIPRCDANPSTSKYRWNQDHEHSFLLEVTTTFRLPLNIVDLLGQTSCFKFKTTTPTMSMTFDRCCANLVESLKAQLQAKLYRVKETMGRMYSWTYAYQVHWGFINNLQAAKKKIHKVFHRTWWKRVEERKNMEEWCNVEASIFFLGTICQKRQLVKNAGINTLVEKGNRWCDEATNRELKMPTSRNQLRIAYQKSKTAKATLVFYWSLGLCVKNLAGDRSGIVSSPPATFTWPGGSMAFVLVLVSEMAMEDGWICATWLLDTAGMCGTRWFCIISYRSRLASI